MSFLSGKCDLCDYIWSGREGDLLKNFENFKEKTKGVIYQNKKINLQEWFGDQEYSFIKSHCNTFDYRKEEYSVVDNRCNGGCRTCEKYIFIYWGKEYNFKDMKKKGIYIEVPIYFNTLLDLLPYFPYISYGTSEHIIVSQESYVNSVRDDSIQDYAHDSLLFTDYKKQLADLYLNVCQNYFLYQLPERTRRISLIGYKPLHNGYYELLVEEPIDYMHDPKFVWKDGKKHNHWESPKMYDNRTFLIAESNIDYWLAEDIKNHQVEIEYVVKPKNGFPTF